MSNQLVGINAENAGLFSDAAYTPIGQWVNTTSSGTPLPFGWSEWTGINPTTDATLYSDSTPGTTDGNNEFRVFINPYLKQFVITFKGTDNRQAGQLGQSKMQMVGHSAMQIDTGCVFGIV